MKHTLIQYIKEVIFFDEEGIDGFLENLSKVFAGETSIEEFRRSIEEDKVNDETQFGDDIYKKEG